MATTKDYLGNELKPGDTVVMLDRQMRAFRIEVVKKTGKNTVYVNRYKGNDRYQVRQLGSQVIKLFSKKEENKNANVQAV